MFQEVGKEQLNAMNKIGESKAGFQQAELIDSCLKKNHQLQLQLEKTRRLLEQKEMGALYQKVGQCTKLSSDLTQGVRKLLISFGDPRGYEVLRGTFNPGEEVGEESERIQFEELQPQGMKIILPRLLPKRINYKDIRHKTIENLDYIRCSYVEAFSNYFADKNFTFQDRVVIYFKHIYSSDKYMKDDDNFDYKIITDMITQYVLVDDNPKYCTKVIDYGYGEQNHTEISIFPIHDWVHHIEMPFC